MFFSRTILTLLTLSSYPTDAFSFITPTSSRLCHSSSYIVHRGPLMDMSSNSVLQAFPSKIKQNFISSLSMVTDFFDEDYDEEDDEENEVVPPQKQKLPPPPPPPPPSYPDPFGTIGGGASFSTSSGGKTLGGSSSMDEEDEDINSIPTTPLPDYLPKLNIVTLSGRVGKDPEPRYFDDGKVVLNLSLACKRKYHPLERQARDIKSGDEETDWFGLELWGRDAEYATRYVNKGMRVGVTGSLVIDSFTDKMTGELRTSPKIIVKHLDILETKAESELRRQNAGKPYNPNRSSFDYDNGNSNSPAGSGSFFD